MTFIVVLVALLIERFFDWSHLRSWDWFYLLECSIAKKMPGSSMYLVLAASIVPALLVMAIVGFILPDILYGFPWLVFQLIALLYCLGARNLWADAFSTITSFTQGDERTVKDTFKQSFYAMNGDASVSQHQQLMNLIFVAANNRVFAVIFWYCLFGLPGALLYRLISVSAVGGDAFSENQQSPLQSSAQIVLAVLDWLPVRIFTFMFALGGNFTTVLSTWRRYAMFGIEANEMLLTECGAAAVLADPANIPLDGSLERNAISMLDRVFIILLVVVLVMVIAI